MFKYIIFFYSLTLCSFAAADTYFVDKVGGYIASETNDSGTKVDKSKEIKTTIRELIKSAISQQGKTVATSPGTAKYKLTPKVLKLGKSYIISVNKISGSQVIFSEKMKADSLSDADVVCDRLVKSVINEKKAQATQQVDTVTQAETRGTSVKTKALRQFYFGFGPGKLNNLGKDDSGVNFTFGYLWGLDHQFSLRLNYEGTSAKDSDASMINLGIGGQYYLSKSKHSAYALGAFNYASAEYDDESCSSFLFCPDTTSDSGFGAKIGGGMHFFRTTSVNFAIEAGYSHGFFKVAGNTPSMLTLDLIVLW